MIKEELSLQQPIVYQALSNVLKSNKIAHSFLLKGESNPLKLKVARLLAQSIIENRGDFACETCETCQRIKDGSYFDVIFIDGSQRLIVKEDIQRIFDEFNKTSLETKSRKVFILNAIENSSLKVWNMILKSMEEPSSENNYWIFITDHFENLLPTIISRCQILSFNPVDETIIAQEYIASGFDEIDAYFLAYIYHEKLDIDLNDKAFLLAKEFVEKTIDALSDPFKIELIFSSEWYSAMKKSDKELLEKSQNYYLDIMIKLLLDTLKNLFFDDEWYLNLYRILKGEDIKELLDIFYATKDLSLSKIDRKLLFDGLAYKIVSYKTRS